MAKLTGVKVSIQIPQLAAIEGTWEPDESERDAAWEMYVELVTRISLAELTPDEGLLREALSSLYTLFGSTREILRKHGPSIAQPKGKDNLSFGRLAIAILNGALRPILAKWHPLLLDHESKKEPHTSCFEHEMQWYRYEELRQVLNDTREVLTKYANVLAEVARVPSLVVETDEKPG